MDTKIPKRLYHHIAFKCPAVAAPSDFSASWFYATTRCGIDSYLLLGDVWFPNTPRIFVLLFFDLPFFILGCNAETVFLFCTLRHDAWKFIVVVFLLLGAGVFLLLHFLPSYLRLGGIVFVSSRKYVAIDVASAPPTCGAV